MNEGIIATVIATLLGPILAVQAQKALERARERGSRKGLVFQNLMATRAARLSLDHVQALNMIDLVFYGRRFLGKLYRTKSEQKVIDVWHEYLDQLATEHDEKTLEIWNAKKEELFLNLLTAMADDLGLQFDRVQLKKGSYSPLGHGQIEREQNLIRELVIKVLSAQVPLKMDVQNFPSDPNMLASTLDLQKKLTAALEGKGALAVEMRKTDTQE
ncbi:MAG: hypothetical protein LLG93_01485 [Deltaproteobacteria bacterium]|nr:hypothetical protein [Deltaproteobacteria bacterium]